MFANVTNTTAPGANMIEEELSFLEYLRIASALASLSIPCFALPYEIFQRHRIASRVSNQVTRLYEQLKVAFPDDATEAERAAAPYLGAVTLGFAIGVGYVLLVEWVQKPFICVMGWGMMFSLSPRSCRVWIYEAVQNYILDPLSRLGVASARPWGEIFDDADMSDQEDTDKGSTGAEGSHWEDSDDVTDVDAMDETDDTWSFDLDTPSESEGSQSNDTSKSPGSTSSERAGNRKAGASEATNALSKPEDATSYLDDFILLPTTQELQERDSKPQDRPDSSDRVIAELMEVKNKARKLADFTVEQMLTSLTLAKPAARRQEPVLTSYVALKPEHQPDYIVILQIVIGTGLYDEKVMVRMHITTPFVQLKDKLRKKDDIDCELVVDDPRGCYPVFDNETPLSVGLQDLRKLFWGRVPDIPKLLDVTGKNGCKINV